MPPISPAQCAGGGAPPMERVLGFAARCNHNPKVRITPEPISGTLRDGFFVMKLSFDIAGDLDTPVSAFAKQKPFEPRFLLESVEGGERLGRYSFIGFGDALEVKLDGTGFHIGRKLHPIPETRDALLDGLRS